MRGRKCGCAVTVHGIPTFHSVVMFATSLAKQLDLKWNCSSIL